MKEKAKQPRERVRKRDLVWGTRKRDGESSWSGGSRRKERLREERVEYRGERGDAN